MLPPAVASSLAAAPLVAFTGSRSTAPPVLQAVLATVRGSVLVGCAAGVDAVVRSALPEATILQASAFGQGRGAFAARSTALVRQCASAGGILLSFPSQSCPIGLYPAARSSKAFCGKGSGTWATLALAVGSGVPVFVFLGSLPSPPAWPLVAVSGGWFRFTSAQLSLF
jgi:hypothetical protein